MSMGSQRDKDVGSDIIWPPSFAYFCLIWASSDTFTKPNGMIFEVVTIFLGGSKAISVSKVIC